MNILVLFCPWYRKRDHILVVFVLVRCCMMLFGADPEMPQLVLKGERSYVSSCIEKTQNYIS
jgi:hypothetical protein